MNKFDRLESWIHDFQNERRPRTSTEDTEDKELLRTTRLFKILTSQPSVHEVFDAQMKDRMNRRTARVASEEPMPRRSSRAPIGFFAFFRSPAVFSGVMALLLIVVGVGLFFQKPVGDRISLLLNGQNASNTNRTQNVNSANNLNANSSVVINPEQNPENPQGEASKNTNNSAQPNVNASTNLNANNKNDNNNNNETEEPGQPSQPPSDEPSNRIALDLSGLQGRQSALTASLASVNQEFDELDTGADPVLVSMSQDFNEISF